MHVFTDVSGDANLGLYGFASDKYCLMPRTKDAEKIEKALGVKVRNATLLDTGLLGIFAKGNSHGIVIPKAVEDYGDLPQLERIFDNVLTIDTDYSALGNLILMNDSGIIASTLLRRSANEIGKFFGLPCAVTTIAGLRVVGNLGIATNKGCLLHPRAKTDEMKVVKATLGVECDIGTVNFGSPYPGAGLIANSRGFLANKATSGPELGRITEALGFL